MTDDVLIVTGGGSGVGRAVCRLAAARGAAVGVLDKDGIAAHATADELPGAGHIALEVDVTHRSQVVAAIGALTEKTGPPTGLAACAGISASHPLEALGAAELRAIFEVNVFGVVYSIQAVVAGMTRAGGGSVVAVSSVAAHMGGGFLGSAHYAASKAALLGLTRALARELAVSRIRVNAVAPGPADTAMLNGVTTAARETFAAATLLGRIAQPEEVAAAILFLLGPESSYITGETLNVNGGAHFG